MTIVGMHYNTNSNGIKNTTLHVLDNFGGYYINNEAGRGCTGNRVETIYVGDFDCSALAVGMDIDVLYDKAIKTQNGIYQPIKQIKILKKQ